MLPQVVRCCLEHAASVAKTFLTSDAVVVDIKESVPMQRRKSFLTPANPLPSQQMLPTVEQRRKSMRTSPNPALFAKQMLSTDQQIRERKPMPNLI